ncbi:MAG: hypothetical protein FD130_1388, partial [Halothiobacillaceae bacterium]
MDSQTVEINSRNRWERRFNLLDELTLFLHITEVGSYSVTAQGEGVKAEMLIEPFLTSRPDNYRAPPYQPSGHPWRLDPGYYILKVRPELKGIVTLSIAASGEADQKNSERFNQLLNNLINPTAKTTTANGVMAANRYPRIPLQRSNAYTLYLNQQPGVRSGMVLRPLPIDLSQP